MTIEEFRTLLSEGGTVPLSASEWEDLAPAFPVEERHPTQLAGDLLIVRVGGDLAALEAPSRDARVARLLGGEDEARAFVAKRMEEYERMWDGCGVKVDYYEEANQGDR
jgi:hypothetical protein